MPKEKLIAKYTGENGEHYMHVPARDLYESDWLSLDDEQKATLGASAFYALRHEAPAEAEKAAKRVEKAPDPLPPMAGIAVSEMPAPQDDGEK